MRASAVAAASLLLALSLVPSSLGQMDSLETPDQLGPPISVIVELPPAVDNSLNYTREAWNSTSKMIGNNPICWPEENPIICWPLCFISCDDGEETCSGGDDGPGFGVGTYTFDRQWVSVGVAVCH